MATDLEPLRHAQATLEAEGTQLRARLVAADRLRKLLESVIQALPDRPALALALLEKEHTFVQELSNEELRHQLLLLQSECSGRAAEAVRDATRTFPRALTDRDLLIDASSRHPKYSIGGHLIDVDLDTRGMVAKVRPRHGDVIREALDVDAVAARVQDEWRRLLDRDFHPQAFLKQLVAAHGAVTKRRKSVAGSPILVRELAEQLAKPTKARLDEFAVDLGRLIGSPSASGLLVTHTRDTKAGLLLWGLEQGGYVGSLGLKTKL